MLNQKSKVVSDALDGKAIDLQLQRVSADAFEGEIIDRKVKGVLNPVIKNESPLPSPFMYRKKSVTLDNFFNFKKSNSMAER